jgi:hypothetical protein
MATGLMFNITVISTAEVWFLLISFHYTMTAGAMAGIPVVVLFIVVAVVHIGVWISKAISDVNGTSATTVG